MQRVGHKSNLKVRRQRIDSRRQFLTVHVNRRLRPGGSYSVVIEFTGFMREEPKGLYRTSYKDSKGNIK